MLNNLHAPIGVIGLPGPNFNCQPILTMEAKLHHSTSRDGPRLRRVKQGISRVPLLGFSGSMFVYGLVSYRFTRNLPFHSQTSSDSSHSSPVQKKQGKVTFPFPFLLLLLYDMAFRRYTRDQP